MSRSEFFTLNQHSTNVSLKLAQDISIPLQVRKVTYPTKTYLKYPKITYTSISIIFFGLQLTLLLLKGAIKTGKSTILTVDSKFLVKRENPNRIFNSPKTLKTSSLPELSPGFPQPPSGGRVACPGGPRSADSAIAPPRSAGSARWRRAPRRHRSLRGSPKTCQSRCGHLGGAGGDFMALCEEMVRGMVLSNLTLSHGHETKNLGFYMIQ